MWGSSSEQGIELGSKGVGLGTQSVGFAGAGPLRGDLGKLSREISCRLGGGAWKRLSWTIG